MCDTFCDLYGCFASELRHPHHHIAMFLISSLIDFAHATIDRLLFPSVAEQTWMWQLEPQKGMGLSECVRLINLEDGPLNRLPFWAPF